MCDRNEVIITAATNGLSACIWDSMTGTSLMKYKGGGIVEASCLSLVGNDYLLCAEKNKPLLHLWLLNSQEVTHSIGRIITSGCVTAMAVSPSSEYCVFAMGERICVWDLGSGELINVTTRHFRSITCIKFTDESSYFVTSGLDGMVIVWPLAYLVSYQASEFLQQGEAYQSEPKYVFQDHSLPVTDLYVGHGGLQSLIVSVSGDQTCKFYCMADGNLLVSLVFNCSLSAVTMSDNEMELFIGTINGGIYKFFMSCMPRTRDYHIAKKDLVSFKGHSKAISCLSTSLNGLHLLSGSIDGKVIIWDIKSCQSIRVLDHKGKINNAFYAICPKNVFLKSIKPTIIIQNFKKLGDSGQVNMTKFHSKEGFSGDSENMFNTSSIGTIIPNICTIVKESEALSDNVEKNEVVKLKQINKNLYSYAVNKILKNFDK